MRTSSSSYLAPFLSLILLSSLACGPGDADPGASGAGDRALNWEPREVFAVGGFDAPDWATFGEIGDVGFDADGNLYIFDDQVAEITVVSPTGEFLRKFGGRGDGPGEIGQPLAMTVFPDGKVAISDLGKRGVALFDAEGEWLGNALLDMSREGLPGPDMMAHPDGGVVSAQALRLFMNESAESEPNLPEGPDTRPVFVYPTTEDGPEAFELHGAWDPPEPPEEDATTMEGGGDGNRISLRMAALQAFEPGLHVAVLADGRVAVVDSTAYRVELFDLAGTQVGEWTRALNPAPVTDAIREMERDRRLAELEGEGSGRIRLLGGGGDVSFDQAQVQEAMRERVEQMSFYPEVPVIVGLAADLAGRLWVERSGEMPGEDGPVDLLSSEGVYLGSLPGGSLGIPEAFGPGGLVAVRETDEFDVATIRILEVPAGGS
jgi:hypothetical protein